MSRIGKKIIMIPEKVKVSYKDRVVKVQGEKGSLERSVHPAVDLDINAESINVVLVSEDKAAHAFQGLTRALVANMISGVSKGFERVLDINGIGYRATTKGNNILFNIGFSHPIDFELPSGISATVDKKNSITLSGIDKELLGQTAATIRSLRPPEPYKGKGIKYAEERIQRKAGKTGAA